MRFLMLNWRDPRNPLAGGAERVSLAFLRGLIERGHEVDWFTFAFPGAPDEEQIDGIRILRSGGVFSSALAARHWCRTQPRFDLVIDQHHGIPWYAPWWSGTNCVAYVHEILGPIWRSFYRWPTSEVGRIQERWTHWLYRRVPFWVPSESTRAGLVRHGVQRVHVFPNGVDVEPLAVLPEKRVQSPVRLATVGHFGLMQWKQILDPARFKDQLPVAAMVDLCRRQRVKGAGCRKQIGQPAFSDPDVQKLVHIG